MIANWKGFVTGVPKYLLVILVILFISFLFPNSSRFKYEFFPNQVWGYDDLIAPFDFVLLKSEREIKEEKEQIRNTAPPCYEADPAMKQRARAKYEQIFYEKLKSAKESGQFEDVALFPDRYRQFGGSLLERAFDRGITKLAPGHDSLPPSALIRLIEGNTSRNITRQALMGMEQMKEVLNDSLLASGLSEAEFLIPVFGEVLDYNIRYSEKLSNKFLESRLADVAESRGLVEQGSLIIQKGGTVTPDKYRELLSYKKEFENRNGKTGEATWVFAGYLILTTLIIGILLLFLQFHAREVYGSFLRMLAVFIWPVIFSLLVFLVEGVDGLSAYLIPFCIVPIIINHFFNARLALFVHIVIVLIASFLSSLGYEFTFLQILAGIIAIFTNLRSGTLSAFFRSMVFIFLTYIAGFLGLSLIQQGGLVGIEWGTCAWMFLNAFLTLLAYPLVPLLEKLFGFTTKITLSELSDMNQPLLQELSIKAPGTLQHSMQVANLSEAAARAIGVDMQLVKVAALYHDVGKIPKAEYYIENQKGENLHNELTPLESARLIIEHVTEGVKLAKKNGLPQVIIDFILTHHGTTRVEYFYRSYLKAHPDEEVDESLFRYPGPKPNTKEQVIMMVADSLEAASKSMKNPSQEEIDNLVDNIIKGKIAQGQFDEAPLSFAELETCKKVFKSTLASIHHVRIKYPEGEKGEV